MFNILKKNKTSYFSLGLCVFTCILFAGLSLQYYKHLQNTIESESSEYLQEVSKQISYNTDRVINNNFAMLGLVATVLKNDTVLDRTQFQAIIKEQTPFWKFQNILLIDRDSTAYNTKGRKLQLGNELPLQEALLENNPSMFTSKVIDGKECIVFLIPVQGILFEGVPIHALAVAYDLNNFDKILSLNAFDNKSYAHIVKNNGTLVIRSTSANATPVGYNILSALTQTKLEQNNSVKQMKQDLLAGKSGFITYELDGLDKYMIYTPLPSNDWSLVTIVPVDAVSVKSRMFLKVTLLICGFITITFAVLLVILTRAATKHRLHLEYIAYVDPITGGNTIQKFIELTQTALAQKTAASFAIVFTNIENFKILNAQFGRQACDQLLQRIYIAIADNLTNNECVGRVAADNFCVLLKYQNQEELIERLGVWYAQINTLSATDKIWLSPMLEFGIYILEQDGFEDINLMIDRAKVALLEAQGEVRGRLRYSFYNTVIGQRLLRERSLEGIMEQALTNQEFQVYLQPKYETVSEYIIGAEALVRWDSKEYGFIYPMDFIPLFERNGFIMQLDLYVFEQVCRTIKKWLDSGQTPIKISVNCSRVQMKKPDFLDKYVDIVNSYQIPFEYLEIELTESVVFEDVEALSRLITQIREYGFGCSMDDFGSGYSSLNLIQDIPIDTIKLDRVFLKNTADMKRAKSVIGSIIRMCHDLDIYIVAEGVETKEQVTMLNQLRCDIIQGYYYARPMPISEFEQLKFGREIQQP